jgi:hypothetical protein
MAVAILILLVSNEITWRVGGPAPIAVRWFIVVLAFLPFIGIVILQHRGRGRLFRWSRGPSVEIQADQSVLRLTTDDRLQILRWGDIQELRLGPFPWWSTLLLDGAGRRLAVILVGPNDPILTREGKVTTIPALVLAYNPGAFAIDRRTLGGDVRLRRGRPDEVGAVEADLDTAGSLTTTLVILAILVIGGVVATVLVLRS